MVALRTSHGAAQLRASRIPDHCAVIGCALTALAALFLMMLAGAARAEQSEFACYDLNPDQQACATPVRHAN